MTTALISHPDTLLHETPAGHPERADRVRAIQRALSDDNFDSLTRVEAIPATIDQIARAHPRSYIDKILTAPAGPLDADTYISAGTARAAVLAAGANVQAVDLVLSGAANNAFCAMRPPGHHAETQTAMGFCFFGNVVIAARHALEHHGLERVAIVDFDVHHGNGTQAMFWDDENLFFGSSHQSPVYPGTGAHSETGIGRGAGATLNCPMPAGAGDEEYREAFEEIILPAVRGFAPDAVLISAGFDAHEADPLASLRLNEEDYVWITRKLMKVADDHCEGRIVSTLEGGYDLGALARSVAVHVKTLMQG